MDKEPTYEEFHRITKKLINVCASNHITASAIIRNEDQYSDIFADVVKAYYKHDKNKSSFQHWMCLQTRFAIQNSINKYKSNNNVSMNNTSYSGEEFSHIMENEKETFRTIMNEDREYLDYLIENSGLNPKQEECLTRYLSGESVSQIATENNKTRQAVYATIERCVEKIKEFAS